MDNNNMYGQGNQNTDQGQPQQQPYQQQAPEQNYNQQYNQSYQQPYQQQQSYQQQPYQPQQSYQQQSYQPDSDLEEPVSFGDWMLSILLMTIPCVNIVMIFVWAFGSGTKKSKANYFRAMLVWTLIWTVLMIIMMIGIGGMMAAISESYY